MQKKKEYEKEKEKDERCQSVWTGVSQSDSQSVLRMNVWHGSVCVARNSAALAATQQPDDLLWHRPAERH